MFASSSTPRLAGLYTGYTSSSKSPAPFKFPHLPVEIAVRILGLAVETTSISTKWSTYRSLVKVSRQMQTLAYEACLPHLPIVLHSLRRFNSFCALLDSKAHIASQIRDVWFIADIKRSAERTMGLEILQKCRMITRIACNINLLGEFITSDELAHHHLKDITLIEAKVPWELLLSYPTGRQLFGQLTHLRTASGIDFEFAEDFCFESLTHLSFSCHSIHRGSSSKWTFDTTRYPVLQQVVPSLPYMQWRTQHPSSLRALGRALDHRIVVVACPKKWKELDVWEQGGPGGKDLWERAKTTEFLQRSRAFTQEVSYRDEYDDEGYEYGGETGL